MTVPLELGSIRSLERRLVALERERAVACDQARSLIALQAALARIAVARAPSDVVSNVLRAAYDPLGFSRGIFFTVDRHEGVRARWQIDGYDTVEPIDETPLEGPLIDAVRHPEEQRVGRAGDLCAPLVDTRSWYVVTALPEPGGAFGLLYLDGHMSAEPSEWELGLVRALATLASVSLENSVLLERTQRLATRDPLTGLYNRRALGHAVRERISAAIACGGGLTYALVDVDDFKRINDAYGHAHGDEVLQRIARTLTAASRTHDVVGRFAGDEFVVVLADVAPATGRALVARISGELRAAELRCSIGAAHFPTDARDANGLLAAADRALYATKAAGKNGFAFA